MIYQNSPKYVSVLKIKRCSHCFVFFGVFSEITIKLLVLIIHFRKSSHEEICFDFLGFTFRPRGSKSKRTNKPFTCFLPSISNRSKSRIRERMRSWKLRQHLYRYGSLERISAEIDSVVRGWIACYGKFYASDLKILLREINHKLARWVTSKYKRFRRKIGCAFNWLGDISVKEPYLFCHWAYGATPSSNKRKSRSG